MIDFEVAWDKLAQFQSSDELAGFFIGEGVKAEMRNPYSCAISRWVQQTTGNNAVTTNSGFTSWGRLTDAGEWVYDTRRHSPAMENFIAKFDNGCYPQLIEVIEVKEVSLW